MKEESYRKTGGGERKRILRTINRTLGGIRGIGGWVVFGSFARRNWFRDIDIAVMGNVGQKEINKVALRLEKKLKTEIDIKLWRDLPDPVKYDALKHGMPKIRDDNLLRGSYKFMGVYSDFVEWWNKWI